MFHNASLIYEVLRSKKTMNNNYQHPNQANFSTQLSYQAFSCLVVRFDSPVIHLNLSKYYAKCDFLKEKLHFFFRLLHKYQCNNKGEYNSSKLL